MNRAKNIKVLKMTTVKTGKIVKYLICLFAAAAVLLLAGGAKMKFSAEPSGAESAKVKAAAHLYIPSAENGNDLRALAEESPEFLIYAASSSELKTLDAGILE